MKRTFVTLLLVACAPAAQPAVTSPQPAQGQRAGAAPESVTAAAPESVTAAAPAASSSERGSSAPASAAPPGVSTGGDGASPVTSSQAKPATLAPTPPGKWSLQELEYWSKLTEEATAEVDRMNKACETSASFAFVQESFRGHFTYGGSYGLTPYVRSSCQSSISAVAGVCARGAPHKAAVKSKIKRVECKYGAPGKTAVELRGGTLAVEIDPDAGGAVAADATTKYLMNSL